MSILKVGLSTYSLLDVINTGEMSVLDAVQWIAANGGEHMEIVPFGYTLVDNWKLAEQLCERAEYYGIELSNYAIPANFIQDSQEAFEAEIDRVKKHVDLMKHMNIKHMRHDVTAFDLSSDEQTIAYFENKLEYIVEGSRRIADYAAPFGITTTIENHGLAVQHSDRVQRVLQAVDRPNFKTTLDIGNFMCVDESPIVGVQKNLPYASLIHFKDFYYRPQSKNPGAGKWIRTSNGNYLRGAIVGHGDIDIREIIQAIKQFGYDDNITLEFEGMEACKEACKIGMDNIKRLWEEEN